MKTFANLMPIRNRVDRTIEVAYNHDNDILSIEDGIDTVELDKKQIKELRDFLNDFNLD